MDSDITLERELRECEERHLRSDVRSSPHSMTALLADEFVEFGSSGRTFDRATAIEASSHQKPFQFHIEAFTVRALAAQVALTTYRLSVWSESGDDTTVTLRSSVWIHRAGRWQMIFHQGTVVSGGRA